MKKTSTTSISFSNILSWAFLLCIAWFGHFNNWWPIAFPLTFTIIVSVLFIIALIACIVVFIIQLRE